MFPRFYFVSDDSLLSILSNSLSVESVKPHLSSLFNDVGSIVSADPTDGDAPLIIGVESHEGEFLRLNQPVSINSYSYTVDNSMLELMICIILHLHLHDCIGAS